MTTLRGNVVLAASSALLGLTVSACQMNEQESAGAPADNTPTASAPSDAGRAVKPPPPVTMAGLRFEVPRGYLAGNSNDVSVVVARPGSESGYMNIFTVATVVDERGKLTPPPADMLAWLRSDRRFDVDDLGRMTVSGHRVPLARVTSDADTPVACGPDADSTRDASCLFTGSPGAVYGFLRIARRTVAVERATAGQLRRWGPRMRIVAPR
jgi:hypothetical protein